MGKVAEITNEAPEMQAPPLERKPFNRRSLIWLTVLLTLSATLDGIVAVKASSTTDEAHHLLYGGHILHYEPDRLIDFCDSQMPISALNAAPQVIAPHLEQYPLLRPLGTLLARPKLTRVPTILASLVLCMLVFLWANDLYGESAAIAACLLCVLSPNLMAHGTLATTDMYHAVGVVGALYFLRRYLLQPTMGNAVWAALALGVAQITKSFALVLYAIAVVAIALALVRKASPALTAKRAALFAVIAALCLLAVLNLAFCFDRTFMPLSAYHFETASAQRLLQQVPLLTRVTVPFPYPFLQGLDLMKYGEETGSSLGNIYLLGELRDPASPDFHGFKSYYAVALFYKEPIALVILFFCGLVWIARRRSFTELIAGEGLLLAEAVILFVWLSFFSKAQIGIRHLLPALAIEPIIAGAAFTHFASKSKPQKTLLYVLVLWLAGSVASYYPQMIPYMNEWVHDRSKAYKILADSNLDWGQEDGIVNDFLRKNSDVVLDPPRHVSGRILVRVNRLTGVDRWTPSAAYLDKQYRPSAMVGYAHFLFDVPAKDAASHSSER
jgi:hypothetical protein